MSLVRPNPVQSRLVADNVAKGDHSICLRSNTSSGFFSTTHIKFYLDITVGSAKKDTT